jgi:hypothetical protein
VIEHVRRGSGLHADPHHRVRDDVVDLLGDAHPLFGDQPLRLGALLALLLGRARLLGRAEGPTRAHGVAGHDGQQQEGRVEQQVDP